MPDRVRVARALPVASPVAGPAVPRARAVRVPAARAVVAGPVAGVKAAVDR
jgi:hypothetical protein